MIIMMIEAIDEMKFIHIRWWETFCFGCCQKSNDDDNQCHNGNAKNDDDDDKRERERENINFIQTFWSRKKDGNLFDFVIVVCCRLLSYGFFSFSAESWKEEKNRKIRFSVMEMITKKNWKEKRFLIKAKREKKIFEISIFFSTKIDIMHIWCLFVYAYIHDTNFNFK